MIITVYIQQLYYSYSITYLCIQIMSLTLATKSTKKPGSTGLHSPWEDVSTPTPRKHDPHGLRKSVWVPKLTNAAHQQTGPQPQLTTLTPKILMDFEKAIETMELKFPYLLPTSWDYRRQYKLKTRNLRSK